MMMKVMKLNCDYPFFALFVEWAFLWRRRFLRLCFLRNMLLLIFEDGDRYSVKREEHSRLLITKDTFGRSSGLH